MSETYKRPVLADEFMSSMSEAEVDKYHKQLAGRELEMVLVWIEHWQRDVSGGLAPTKSSLDRAAFNIRNTLQEIQS